MLANIFKQITLSLSTKMVFVVRTDLKMSTGKIASQCAHAAVILTTSNTDTGMLKLWMLSGQSKVVLKVNSEDKLEDLKQTAVAEGLNVCVVCDAGRTQVESGTATVLGIGPHKVEDVDRITKDTMEEKLLDEENWKHEAQAVIDDVKQHVSNIELSKVLKTTNQHIYINLTTIEKEVFCVQLSAEGFKIVGRQYDVDNIDSEEYFETPYSLLNKISPLYNNSFGNALINKLNELNKQQL